MLKKIMIFAAGAITGTVVGARLVKKRYEDIANEEIEEIRAYYKEREKEQKAEVEEKEQIEEPVAFSEEEKAEYNDIRFKYSTETMLLNEQAESSKSGSFESYIIDPSEYGNEGQYATETLTYFADGVLVNEVDEVIEDWDTTVGRHHIEVFEEFPDATTVYVRCDWEGMDYEIIKDDWCWSDIQQPEKKPHQL